MIGSYFDYTGAPIHAGAAGLGDLERVQSFHDGVLGSQFVPVDYGDGLGPIQAYRDGALGAYEQAAAGIGYPLFIDGKPVDRPVTIRHAPSGYGCKGCGGVDPSGLGAYVQAMAGDPYVLDLTDVATLRELRGAIAMFVPELALVDKSVDARPNVGTAYFDDRFYESDLWTQKDNELWAAAEAKIHSATGSTYPSGSLSKSKNGSKYPSPLGAAVVTSLGVGSPGYAGFGDFAKNFPTLYAFLAAATASGMDMGKFSCVPPYATSEERAGGGGATFAGMSTKTLAIAGLVVAGALGAWYFTRRRRASTPSFAPVV